MSDFSFLNNGVYMIIEYYKNGNKYCETEYKDGKLHGKELTWYESGNKHCEREYKNSKLHGKYISWYESGNKCWEADYKDGKQHGKSMGWHENGNKHWEGYYYWEDKRVSEQEYLSLSNLSENCDGKIVEIGGKRYTLKQED